MAEKSKRGVGAVGCLWKQLSLQGTAARLGGGAVDRVGKHQIKQRREA